MYKSSLLLILLSGVTLGQPVALGTRLEPMQLVGVKPAHCATSPSQTWSCADLLIEGAEFKVGYETKTRIVKYLFTNDKHFKTSEGLRVENWIWAQPQDLVLVPGWRIYGPRTADKWRTVIGIPFHFNNQTQKLELSGTVRFEDGTTVDLSKPGAESRRTGKVKILGFEKGGAVR